MGVQKKRTTWDILLMSKKIKKKIVTQMQMCMLFSISCI